MLLQRSSKFLYLIFRNIHNSFEFVMKKKRVCVIGAGAAGLVAIRPIKNDPFLEGCVFEQDERVGGVWNYTDSTGNNSYGIPIHSTAYKGLRTNLPKEVMGYLDYPFPDSEYSYVMHDEVLHYLQKYAKDHNLEQHIHFTTRVLAVEPNDQDQSKSLSSPAWKVRTENLKTKSINEHQFDSVIVCNGHYTKPNMPDIKNLDIFTGEIWHSRDYRRPEVFQGKKVIVLGGGPSAIDISIELAEQASHVVLSCKASKYKIPEKITVHSPVVEAKQTAFVTATGEEIECDAILLCSGYVYDFPFLSPKCDVTVEKGKYIFPLYRHLIHAKRPSMAFIGIPFTVCPFPQFDIQVRYFLKTLTGEVRLPTAQVMLNEIKMEEKARAESSVPFNHSHKFGDAQWAYNEKLAQEAGFPDLILPVIRKAYDRSGERRIGNPANYKYDFVRLVDKENFVYKEDFYEKPN